MVSRRVAETNYGRGTKAPAVFIVLDENAPFSVLSLPRIDHLAAGGAEFLVMCFYDMTFWPPQLDCFKLNTQNEK
jgi:hypothetical protein